MLPQQLVDTIPMCRGYRVSSSDVIIVIVVVLVLCLPSAALRDRPFAGTMGNGRAQRFGPSLSVLTPQGGNLWALDAHPPR